MNGKKADAAKLRLDLLPVEALEEISKVLAFGAIKYGDWNWKQGMRWQRLSAAALRHLFAWMRGETLDQETSLSHLAHACCCLLFLLTYEILKLGKDDRWQSKETKIRIPTNSGINWETISWPFSKPKS